MEQQSLAERRKKRMESIRLSLGNNPAILATNSRLSQKIQKKSRRTSIQIGDKQLTIPQVSDQFPSDDEEISTSLFLDRYHLGEKTGEGAHGVVKKCVDKQTGEVFAVKTITLEREHILFLKKNFLDVKALKHPHILTYKALFFQLKYARCYLVMDYLPYPDLVQVQVKSQEQLKWVVYQLLQTLKYIHQNKICHRDIKPDNILYNRQNRSITIIDFGISKKIQERGRKREMLTLTGTPYYRAPQMFQGGGYDEMVDMWALGVTIFKLMTGSTPFESEYHSDTISNIVKGELVFPEKLKLQCSQHPKNLVRRLLKKNKGERLTAEAALRDPWFLDIKNNGDDDLIRSVCLNKNENNFNPKLSVNFGPIAIQNTVGKQSFKKEAKQLECYKIINEIKEEAQVAIFGMQESLKI